MLNLLEVHVFMLLFFYSLQKAKTCIAVQLIGGLKVGSP